MHVVNGIGVTTTCGKIEVLVLEMVLKLPHTVQRQYL